LCPFVQRSQGTSTQRSLVNFVLNAPILCVVCAFLRLSAILAHEYHLCFTTHRVLEEFLSHLPAGASILELGCGSGRDSAEMLRLGYDVFPTYGTPAIAREAEKRLGRPVAVLRFGEIAGEERFDGVWACACLLHVPIGSLGNVLKRIHGILRLRGMFFASFKAGNGEGRGSIASLERRRKNTNGQLSLLLPVTRPMISVW
jgi:SAM-dependent methyltransferase